MMGAYWVLLFNYLPLTYTRIQRDLRKMGLKRKRKKKKQKAWKFVCVFAHIHLLFGTRIRGHHWWAKPAQNDPKEPQEREQASPGVPKTKVK